jgi:hypothetical protein
MQANLPSVGAHSCASLPEQRAFIGIMPMKTTSADLKSLQLIATKCFTFLFLNENGETY